MEATELLPALKENIDNFVGEAPQFDDITMLIFDYKQQYGGDDIVSKIFPAKIETLSQVISFVEDTLENYECSIKAQTAMWVAVEEIFVNVANYAYGEGVGDVTISIGFDEESRTVTFRISDKGVPFNPLNKPDPDTTLSVEEREIGGL